MSDQSPFPALYHPRHWFAWMGIGLLKLITLLPFNLQLWLGRWLGRGLMPLAKRRRHIAKVNLDLCFPNLSEAQREKLLRKTFESQGMALMEMAHAWLGNPSRLLSRVHDQASALIREEQAKGKGVLLIGAHYNTADIAGSLLGLFVPYDIIYRPQKSAVVTYIMERGRARFLKGGTAFQKSDVRAMYGSLRKGRTLWYPADQDYGRRHSVFAPFFGVSAATIDAPTRMVKQTGANVLMSYYYRDKNKNYVIHAERLEGFTGTDSQRDAEVINAALERLIRQHPEQYMWVHRRFKTRPEGEEPVY
ncbi:MAG: LpxL/LpxP family Kdo(2)-lipid IV(A) lauroyl/palmitoleoyl acyltransferase [Pseudomonadales bacterium]